jgi:hypothetical protein
LSEHRREVLDRDPPQLQVAVLVVEPRAEAFDDPLEYSDF